MQNRRLINKFLAQSLWSLIRVLNAIYVKSIHVGFSSQGQIIKFFGSVIMIMFCK
jgi:hypothetical protein